MTEENPYQAPRAVSVAGADAPRKQTSERPPWHYGVGALAACLVPALGWFLGGLSDGALGGGHGSALPGLFFIGLPLLLIINELVPLEWCGLGTYAAYVCTFVLIWRVFNARYAARAVLVAHCVSVLSGIVVLSGLSAREMALTELGKVSRLLGLPFHVACGAFLFLTVILFAVAIKRSSPAD